MATLGRDLNFLFNTKKRPAVAKLTKTVGQCTLWMACDIKITDSKKVAPLPFISKPSDFGIWLVMMSSAAAVM